MLFRSRNPLTYYYVNVEIYYDNDCVSDEEYRLSMSEGSFSYTVDQQVNDGGQLLECVSATTQYLYYGPGNASTLVFQYQSVDQPDKKVGVNFIDTNGYVIGTDEFTVSVNENVIYEAPEQISANGTVYDLVSDMSITHGYASSKTSYSFQYKAQKAVLTKSYSVKFKFIDAETKEVIGTDSQPINSGETLIYTVPETWSVGAYTLSAGQPREITHKFEDSSREYSVLYDATGSYDITISLIDVKSGTVIDTFSETVDANTVAVYDYEPSVSANGVNYILAGGQGSRLTHAYGESSRTYEIYYNPESTAEADAEAQPYTISIEYVDVKTNDVLYTEAIDVAAFDSSFTFL